MRLKNAFYFVAGVLFLALARLKHSVVGYTPKPWSIEETDRCIDYDVNIAENWLKHLRNAGGSFAGQAVLELGPGSDLGTGAYLVSKGARSYTAFDRNDIASKAPEEFYARFSSRFPVDRDKLRFVAREDFDLSVLPVNSVDLVVSNAAFEHFDDVSRVVRQLSAVVKPGGLIVAVIDLQTHSRWIREKDPNNIYRYPDWLYRMFYFPGQPNRVRPAQYRRHFEDNGWRNVSITIDGRFDSSRLSVNEAFRACPMLDARSIVLTAIR